MPVFLCLDMLSELFRQKCWVSQRDCPHLFRQNGQVHNLTAVCSCDFSAVLSELFRQKCHLRHQTAVCLCMHLMHQFLRRMPVFLWFLQFWTSCRNSSDKMPTSEKMDCPHNFSTSWTRQLPQFSNLVTSKLGLGLGLERYSGSNNSKLILVQVLHTPHVSIPA